MYEYEMAQLKTAELRREAETWRQANEAARATRERGSEGQVVERKGGVRQALRSLRPHSAP
jgi:hypothetical protein